MSIDWKSLQTVAIVPFESYKSSSANRLTYTIDEEGRGVIFGMKVTINDLTTFKITHGVCLKDNTVIKYNNDVLLPLSETHYAVGNNYVVLRFKYIETRNETFHYSTLDCIPVADYDPEWYLILASCQIDSNGHIITVDDTDREIVDINDHQKLNNLQGGNGIDEFYHLTESQWLQISDLLSDNVIDHNTELSGLEGGDGTHYYHLSQTLYDDIVDLFDGNAPFVLKAGDTMTGVLNMSGHNISGVADAINDDDAVNKGQLDDAINNAGIHVYSITIDTTHTHNESLAISNAGIFFVEPDNIGSNVGNEFLLLKNGYECRLGLAGDVLELRYKATLELAATLTLNADSIDVTFTQDFSGNPNIIIAYIAGGTGGTGGTSGGTSGDRGVFGGGYVSYNVIDYITISTPGNALDFGDLTGNRYLLSATSNGTNDRGVFGGGYNHSNYSYLHTIDYITISSPGNALYFGSLTVARDGLAATSNGTNNRGVFGGGYNDYNEVGNFKDTIDYITISASGNATDFGDLTGNRFLLSATSNGTNDRGVFGGGAISVSYTLINVIDYIIITTIGDAIDFGDLTVARYGLSATSNGTNDRGVFGGGTTSTNYTDTIDYVTISTPGNAIDFGNLSEARGYLSATSNGVNDRGVFGGGYDGNYYLSVIDYITISTPGDATDFGDLTVARARLSATSNSLT